MTNHYDVEPDFVILAKQEDKMWNSLSTKDLIELMCPECYGILTEKELERYETNGDVTCPVCFIVQPKRFWRFADD